MKENTAGILTYTLLVAAFAYMIGWVSGELICRCKNAEERSLSSTTNLKIPAAAS
jgi:hypothetical protein